MARLRGSPEGAEPHGKVSTFPLASTAGVGETSWMLDCARSTHRRGHDGGSWMTAGRGSPVIATHRSAVIIDNDDWARVRLERSFRALGCELGLASDFRSGVSVARTICPELLVTELRIGAEWAFEAIGTLRKSVPACRIVIVTAFPSVATAVRAVRLGTDLYLAKPVTARMILHGLSNDDFDIDRSSSSHDLPSLDRTIWEYLNQAYVAAGSMASAARQLGLDRRSLRRMLGKHPPAR